MKSLAWFVCGASTIVVLIGALTLHYDSAIIGALILVLSVAVGIAPSKK